MSPSLTLAFHGAAGTVTGSKHLLTCGDARVLIDAGLFQGRKKLRLRNWRSPEFDPKSVDYVLLTHSHIDHVGYLPRLARLGLEAPVISTPAAFELLELMLLDAAKIQEEDAHYANQKKFSRHDPALPLFTVEDAQQALKLRRSQPYGEWLELTDGLRVRFLNAGHILGAAFIEVHAATGEREVRIVFSGDVGRYAVPLHRDPDPRPGCDVLIVESTYGDRLHPTTDLADQIARPFCDAMARGGTILIPAFAVGRSQLVTLILRRMMKAGQLPEVPIHIDSPMAVEATGIYGHFLDRRNVDADVFADGRHELFPDHVRLHRTVAESKELNHLPGPRIIVAPSGMMTAGRVLHHLERLAGDRRNLLVTAGYQAEGTRARAIVEGARTVKIHGHQVPVRCHVLSLHGLSGHGDRDELLRWVGSTPEPPALSFVVHGEPAAAGALAHALVERLGGRIFVPHLGARFDLSELLAEVGVPAVKPPPPPEVTPPQPPVVEDPEIAERIRVLLQSPTYRRADQDVDFLQREELRSVRLELEYLKPELTLRQAGVEGTIVVFGGARIREPEAARYELALARAAAEAEPGDRELAHELALAERRFAQSRYYEVARELGRILGRAAGGPGDHRLLAMTGGGPGIMEAVNRGADDVGAPSIGLNITLPHEQRPNPYVTPELCFEFRYFALRKMHFLKRARAMVAFPGGFGTLDELFDALCLIQTRKIEPLPVVLVGESFWRRALNFDYLVAEGTIAPQDVELFTFAETAEEIRSQIRGWWEKAGGPEVKI